MAQYKKQVDNPSANEDFGPGGWPKGQSGAKAEAPLSKGPPRRNSPLKNYSQNESYAPGGFPKKKK